ncbi:single-stranded DNA-binding protein [Pseudomonas asiatica]|uniref:single-stranded DNA-binding protein n=1 Tax=Pseudomonas asiatica TaxID=2219225 RepID=UPI00345DE8AA
MSYSINKTHLLGTVGADPVSTPLGNGNSVVKVSLATSRGWMEDGAWKEVTDWHNIAFFGKSAERALKIKKGMAIFITGRNQTSVYEKSGVKCYRTEVVVDMKGELEILGYPSLTRQNRAQGSPSPQQQRPAPNQPAQQPPHFEEGWRDGEFGADDQIPVF